MGYKTLIKEHLNTVAIEPVVPLISQTKLAILASIVAIIFVTLAIIVSYSKKQFVYKLTVYTILSIIGSLFLAMATIFTSNSFGVYI
ncbi:dolichyl-diphosphooligosaccharide--protein glycosyltransferase subunit Ost5p [Monosporozyma servazzii]